VKIRKIQYVNAFGTSLQMINTQLKCFCITNVYNLQKLHRTLFTTSF